MDYKHFRSLLETSGVDIWTLIDTAVSVASSDHADELKHRRDAIVASLYSASSLKNPRKCPDCDDLLDADTAAAAAADDDDDDDDDDDVEVVVADAARVVDHRNSHVFDEDEEEKEKAGDVSPYTPQSVNLVSNNDGNLDRDMRFGDLFDEDENENDDDDEQTRILNIRDRLEDPAQIEEYKALDLLQTLADMDLSFKALKDTDIGRHVNRLRKHSSNKVRVLVKQLVNIWKETVDEWMRLNRGQASSSAAFLDEDSPQQKLSRNSHHRVSDFANSPNPHNGSSGSDMKNRDQEPKRKGAIANQENSTKPNKSYNVPAAYTPNRIKEQKETIADAQRFSTARKRLQDNYKEAENAKKQRTIQVMEVHEIPKKKNTFFSKNKGSSHNRPR